MASSFNFAPKTHYLVYAHGQKKNVMPQTASFYWDPTTNVATLCILKNGNKTAFLEMRRGSTTSTTWIGTYTGKANFKVFLTDFTLNGTTISGNASRNPGDTDDPSAGVYPPGPADDQGSFVGIKQ